MRRFFMTIPEAVQLVLQAAALGHGGEIFVLDMGELVKMVDLAKDLIELSGLTPDEDIKIIYTGTRPGEKLYEELLQKTEDYGATQHAKIFVFRDSAPPRNKEHLESRLAEIAFLARQMKTDQVLYHLHQLVPEYRPEDKLPDPT
jgi:FlaA1/EpsC-like NDP-sugar epimerase